MSVNWLKNLVGFTLSDEEMKDIANPQLELYTHVTIKNMQAFSILGMVLAAPLTVALRGPRNLLTLRAKCVSFAKGGAVLGIPTGPAMTYMVASKKGIDQDGFYDRSYRLRNHRGQVRVDRFWIVGGLAGIAAAYATAGVVSAGAVLGANAGVLLTGVYNNVGSK